VAKISRSFPKELLIEWEAPYNYEVWSETEDVGRRWMDVCTVVFKAPDDGHLYKLSFDVGKTEYQDNYWYEELDEIVTLPRVEQLERTVVQKYWVQVED
jgi:hypothetical protein